MLGLVDQVVATSNVIESRRRRRSSVCCRKREKDTSAAIASDPTRSNFRSNGLGACITKIVLSDSEIDETSANLGYIEGIWCAEGYPA